MDWDFKISPHDLTDNHNKILCEFNTSSKWHINFTDGKGLQTECWKTCAHQVPSFKPFQAFYWKKASRRVSLSCKHLLPDFTSATMRVRGDSWVWNLHIRLWLFHFPLSRVWLKLWLSLLPCQGFIFFLTDLEGFTLEQWQYHPWGFETVKFSVFSFLANNSTKHPSSEANVNLISFAVVQ